MRHVHANLSLHLVVMVWRQPCQMFIHVITIFFKKLQILVFSAILLYDHVLVHFRICSLLHHGFIVPAYMFSLQVFGVGTTKFRFLDHFHCNPWFSVYHNLQICYILGIVHWGNGYCEPWPQSRKERQGKLFHYFSRRMKTIHLSLIRNCFWPFACVLKLSLHENSWGETRNLARKLTSCKRHAVESICSKFLMLTKRRLCSLEYLEHKTHNLRPLQNLRGTTPSVMCHETLGARGN